MTLKMFDGAMGTQLQALGIADKPCPEYAAVTDAALVTAVHREYVEAGADIIETNTFGANRLKLKNFGLESQVAKIVTAAVRAARAACGQDTLLAGSVGPTGQLVAPLGICSFDETAAAYEEEIKALSAAGVDYILIETILDLQEMRAAVLAAKAVCRLPIVAQLTFDENARTVTGTNVAAAAATLESLGVSVIGMNCSLGPEQLLPLAAKLAEETNLPISVQPNAGLPSIVGGKTVFPLSPAEMAAWTPRLVAAGAVFVGGCCGTTPAHIKAMKKELEKCSPAPRRPLPQGVRLASRGGALWIGSGHKTALIGERINPTGRKALAEELKSGGLIGVKREALAQAEAGAAMLDINAGVPGIDQAAMMRRLVEELSAIADLPFSIDSTEPKVIEAGIRHFPGRALINSVSGKQPEQDAILALAKRYGAAVIVLPLSGKELPKAAEDRLKIASKIIKEAKEAGLGDGDIVLDALVLTAAADGRAPVETLRTLKLYKERFNYPTTMGLSNVSFGLPGRELINAAFFLMALANGLDAPIINPLAKHIKELLAAASVINGQDSQGMLFSAAHARAGEEKAAPDAQSGEGDIIDALQKAVARGEKELAVELTAEAYQSGRTAIEIVNRSLTGAMDEIGDKFARGKAFLPQVMLAAEAMRAAFDFLKEKAGQEERPPSQGKILLATVEGDIHDLGKNIVATLMQSSGFEIIDLGKDVPSAAVWEAAEKEKPDIVGLCALMTTTLEAMSESIDLLRKNGYRGGIMVGGAVLTAAYAEGIGAGMYARDALAAVKLAKEWVKNAKGSL